VIVADRFNIQDFTSVRLLKLVYTLKNVLQTQLWFSSCSNRYFWNSIQTAPRKSLFRLTFTTRNVPFPRPYETFQRSWLSQFFNKLHYVVDGSMQQSASQHQVILHIKPSNWTASLPAFLIGCHITLSFSWNYFQQMTC
jgi:hypothetical protein